VMRNLPPILSPAMTHSSKGGEEKGGAYPVRQLSVDHKKWPFQRVTCWCPCKWGLECRRD